MVVIFAAEGIEAQEIEKVLDIAEPVPGPWRMVRGQVGLEEVVLLEAGIGKVASAAAVAYANQKFAPKYAIWAGVGGGLNPDLKVFDIVVANDAVQYDFDLTAFGRAPGELSTGERFIQADFEVSQKLFKTASGLNLNVAWGRIASGDAFVADHQKAEQIHKVFEADVIEMEGASALWTAKKLGLRLALLRAISDGAGGEAKVSFEEFIGPASRQLGSILKHLLVN